MTADEAQNRPLIVRLPDGPPELTPAAARTLVAILVELTDIPVLDPPEETPHDH